MVTLITILDRPFIYFPLFWLQKCLRGRVVRALGCNPSDEDRTAGSVPVQPGRCGHLCQATQIHLYVRKTQTEALFNMLLVITTFYDA